MRAKPLVTNLSKDPILNSIAFELVNKYRCHTVVLYGSRARGLTTATSDYDVLGICKRGKKIRIAKKQKGFFWDVFVYPEKELRTLGEQHFVWKNARVVYEKGQYGRLFLKRLMRLVKKPFKPRERYELVVTKVWAQKQMDRCRETGIQALFRRVEFLSALVSDYFFVRQKRFPGPKEGFAWIESHDLSTYKLIEKALRYPDKLSHLRAAARRVYRTTIV